MINLCIFSVLLFASLSIYQAIIAYIEFTSFSESFTHLIPVAIYGSISFLSYRALFFYGKINSEKKQIAKNHSDMALEKQHNLSDASSHKPLAAVYLGGANMIFPEGVTVYLSTIADKFVISQLINDEELMIPITNITAIEISGPGSQTTNAGLIGGGFGLEGALKGMIAAALINAATTKTTTNTFLRVATSKSEAIFHFNDQEPSALRLKLSHLFVAAEANKALNVVSTSSISDELSKLQSLKETGVISEDEFCIAKQKLLA